ncbi:MAG: TonB-dependent receptor family protein [Bacteroidales bacterium]|jgi:hypothetical protein|nr:TonB-dependent receptor family protein [Bacteroidales bacterium]
MKKKHFLLLAMFWGLLTGNLFAQFSIVGQIKDTMNDPVATAMVMLLNSKDSILVNYTMTNDRGTFSFKNIRKANYILKVSHMSYMPIQKMIVPKEDEKEINMGVIKIKPIANFLMEIVIKEAKAPIFIKGDTVEYDATTFKVPPGSTVEDLLRRLPGIEVDANGGISTMGKDVKTVYVDGKAFFGTDPKTVTQNLDAAAVHKVQVFNEQTEQEKITGIKDGAREKVMNLELKNEYKKGYFGKATVGYGSGIEKETFHRWLARGNFNWFTETQQLSFLGYGNNINESNFNWSDYSDFKGQSMTTGFDNGTFGFSNGRYGGGGMRFRMSGYSGGDGSGFSQNAGGGVNYNYYKKKTKFNAGYFYTRNYTYSDQFANRQTFLTDSTYLRTDTSNNSNVRNNHSFSTRWEYDIDSNNNIIVRADLTYALTTTEATNTQFFQTADFFNINRNEMKNTTDNGSWDINTLAIYTHRFKKKGRTFAMSGNYVFSDGKSLDDINNLNTFFHLSDNEQIKFIVKNSEKKRTHTARSSLLYVEPLGKMFTLQSFYNFSASMRDNRNESEDAYAKPVDSLWIIYKNTSLYNRLGTSLNFAKNGINIMAGLAYQNLNLKGHNSLKTGDSTGGFSYHNLIPYIEADFELPHDLQLDASYSYSVDEPDISYLFPMPDLSNNLYKTEGNPSLTTERYHEINTRFGYWNRAAMYNISLSANADFYESQIVYNQTTEFVDSVGYVTVSRPENVKGGDSYSLYLWSHFPIVKTILTMSLSLNGNLSHTPVFINAVKNITNTSGVSGNVGFNITAGEKLNFNASGSISNTYTQYSIQRDRNQNYMNYSANAGFKWQMLKKTFLEGNYRFSNYNNKKLEFTQNIHTLNLSVRQVIGKKNQFELRFAAIDLLNQNQYIRQIAATNYVEYRTSPTLARYFLLTFAYNLRGFDISNSSQRRMMRH